MTESAHELRLKRLRYRAGHRGVREMDLILGGFAARALGGLSSAELDQFEALLEIPDPDLYAWLSGQREPPAQARTAVFEKIRASLGETHGALKAATNPQR